MIHDLPTFSQTSTIHVGRYTVPVPWILWVTDYSSPAISQIFSQLFEAQYVPAAWGQGRPVVLGTCA